jgi:hypothetical protein
MHNATNAEPKAVYYVPASGVSSACKQGLEHSRPCLHAERGVDKKLHIPNYMLSFH